MKLTEDQIGSIVGDLEAGFKCYIHKISHEVISIPDFDAYGGRMTPIPGKMILPRSKNTSAIITKLKR